MRLIGMGQPAAEMYGNQRAWTYDVKELGFRYELPATPGVSHYQEICPACRRALFGLAQGALWTEPT